jgi:hypothetical protein
MASTATDLKQEAHELIDSMAPGQISAVVGLLKIIVDPVARSIANAPYDDEPVSEEENREMAARRAAIASGEGIVSHEEVLKEFGLTMAIGSAWAVLRSNRRRRAGSRTKEDRLERQGQSRIARN